MTLSTRSVLIAAGLVLAVTLLSVPALAQRTDSNSVVALHVQAHDTKGISCSDLSPTLACRDFTSTWPVHSGADVYMVVARADSVLGIAALSCGISYSNPVSLADGVGCDVFAYAACSDLEYPNSPDNDVSHEFPWSGGGNVFVWTYTNNCQRTVRGADGAHAVVAVFYVYAYSADYFAVTRNENLQLGPQLLVSDCSLATWPLSYPDGAGKIGFGTLGYNPCEGSTDTTPPQLLTANGTYGSPVVVLNFDEDVYAGANVLSNYSMYPTNNPASPLTLTGAAASGHFVTLTLDSGLSGTNTSYTVSVTGVADFAGNVITTPQTASFTTGSPDTTPPTLFSASGDSGSTAIAVRFSEIVSLGANVPSNYTVYPTASPSSPLPVLSATVSSAVVTLGLGTPLAAGTGYTVVVSNVEDAAGNVIAPNSSISFTTTAPDLTPPVLQSASGTSGDNHVVLTFSEPVSNGVSTASNYHLYPTGDPSSPIAVTGATRLYNVVTVILASNLAPSTTYTIEVSNIEDLYGNPVAPNSSAEFTTDQGDIVPPTLLAATGTSGQNKTIVTFSERVGTGSNVEANFSVYPTANPSAPLGVSLATPSLAQVTLTLASNLAAATSYTVEVSNVQDLAGNAIAPNSTASFTTAPADTIPPTLVSASGAPNSNVVTVRFSETVAGGADTPSNYEVYPAVNPSASLSVASATPTGSQVGLSLGANLAGATTYVVRVSNVADAAGNPIAPNSTVSFTTDVSGGYFGDQRQAFVAAHVQAHNTKGSLCDNLDPDKPCDQFVTTWPVNSPADVYFVVANADENYGVSGVSLGVTYGNTPGARADGQGCDVFGYVACSDLEYTNGIDPNDLSTEFPAAGGGNRLIWVRTTNCQRHVVGNFRVQAIVCAFYVYAYGPDHFTVDKNRNLQTGAEFQIVDCPGPSLSDLDWPGHAGEIDFGPGYGFNPCSIVVPTVHTTWGKLKNQYH